MNPEQVAVVLRTIDGVSQVDVRRDQRGRFRSLNVRYSDVGVVVDGLKVEVQPVFVGEGLTEVSLTGSACAGASRERGTRLGRALRERYVNFGRESVVDDQGVQFDQRLAFWNDQTRVRMSWQVNALPQGGGYSSTNRGVAGALAGLANAMADSERDAAIAACPSDGGVKVVTTINYSSQQEFVRTHEAEVRRREEQARRTRDAL